MKTYCNYHPTEPASWDCELCDIFICDDCVVSKKDVQFGVTKTFHLCPKCNRRVTWMGISNVLTPFWNRLPRFFIYPFSAKPLILNIILCVSMLFFSRASLFSNLMRFVVWGIWLKYAFAALQSTARGSLIPPDISTQTLSENFEDVFKQIGIYLALIFGAGLVMGTFGKGAGILFGIFSLLFLPSMIILLVSTQSLLKALNPVAFISLPARIGWGYLNMYVFLAVLGGAPILVLNLAAKIFPPLLAYLCMLFFQNYYTLISYNLMGYVLLQYHEEIGFQVDYEDFIKEKEGPKNIPKASSPIANEVDMHLKEANYEKALDILRTEINRNNTNDPELYDRYYQLLKIKKMTAEMVTFGKKYIDQLIVHKNESKAGDVYLECSGIDKEFILDPKQLLKIGGWLKKSGRSKEAIRVYAVFTKAYSKDPMIPMAYFRAAEIYNETLGQKQKANNMLNAVIKKYPDHEITPFIKNYLKQITA